MDWTPGIAYFFDTVSVRFLAPGSQYSLTSLAAALCVAAGFIALRRYRRNRRIRIKTIARALPRHI